MFDVTRYRALLKRAIGKRTQKEFANIAGLSPYNLNRMLSDNAETVIPRRSTLQKIAEASEGRVTEPQLLEVCGYLMNTVTEMKDLSPEDQNLQIAMKYKSGLEKACGSAMKYASLEDFLETVSLTDGLRWMHSRIGSEESFMGTGHKNAESLAHCAVVWIYGNYDARLDFTVLFCKTEKGGYIISDIVFDLDTLIQLKHQAAMNFMFHMAEKGDVTYSDFPIVFRCRKQEIGEAEKRLLKAIFGENRSDENGKT